MILLYSQSSDVCPIDTLVQPVERRTYNDTLVQPVERHTSNDTLAKPVERCMF